MNKSSKASQNGQTLIETVVALFVLITGIGAGLALAIYSFGTTSDTLNKVIATSLAREGIETVRAMRDGNWNNDIFQDCSDIGVNQPCSLNWLNNTYNIAGSAGAGISYRMNFDPSSSGFKFAANQTPASYRLYVSGTAVAPNGYTNTATAIPSNFFRKVSVIYENTNAPYTPSSPLVLLRSVVWWYGKNCNNALTNFTNPSDTLCKVAVEEHLSNWKNY